MRLAPRRRAGRLGAALVVCALAACSRGGPGDVSVLFNLGETTPDPITESSRVRFVLIDQDGRHVHRARVRLEGHMAHPGMAPVVVEAAEVQPGVYEARPAFTMAGEWRLLVAGTLADGTRITDRRQQATPRIIVHEEMVRRGSSGGGTP